MQSIFSGSVALPFRCQDTTRLSNPQTWGESLPRVGVNPIGKLLAMKLEKAARIVREGVDETLAYMAFPHEHWLKIRTNNPLERIMREIRRRTRVVGNFPDGNSALLLVAARLRYIAGTRWGNPPRTPPNALQISAARGSTPRTAVASSSAVSVTPCRAADYRRRPL